MVVIVFLISIGPSGMSILRNGHVTLSNSRVKSAHVEMVLCLCLLPLVMLYVVYRGPFSLKGYSFVHRLVTVTQVSVLRNRL